MGIEGATSATPAFVDASAGHEHKICETGNERSTAMATTSIGCSALSASLEHSALQTVERIAVEPLCYWKLAQKIRRDDSAHVASLATPVAQPSPPPRPFRDGSASSCPLTEYATVRSHMMHCREARASPPSRTHSISPPRHDRHDRMSPVAVTSDVAPLRRVKSESFAERKTVRFDPRQRVIEFERYI